MAGDIFFGFDRSMPAGKRANDGYVNSPTFDAFGDLMDAALAETHAKQLEKIREGQYQMLFNFCDLSAADYNAVIQTMRAHIASLSDPTDWQQKGTWVWREMAEPFIRKDERYDFAFHGEARPDSSS